MAESCLPEDPEQSGEKTFAGVPLFLFVTFKVQFRCGESKIRSAGALFEETGDDGTENQQGKDDPANCF